jgi:hypothetical protein
MTEISRIEIFCEDKLVGRIQRTLAGLGVLNVKSMPVTNAKIGKNGKLEAKSSGDLLEMFITDMRDRKMKTITPEGLQTFMAEAGRSIKSYSNLLTKAIAAKVLKRTKGTSGRTIRYDIQLKSK